MVIVSTNLPIQTQVAPNPVVFLPITNQRKLCMGQMAHMLHPVRLNGGTKALSLVRAWVRAWVRACGADLIRYKA